MKEQEINDIAEMANHLDTIYQKLSFYRAEYCQTIHAFSSYMEYMNCCDKQLMALLMQETAGRSLSSGLSKAQISLSIAAESLEVSKRELEAVCRAFKKTVDRLTIIREAIETCMESIKRIESNRAHPNGQA